MLDNLVFDMLEVGEANWLEAPFEEREVVEVVKGMDRDKASSPYGFSMASFQDCWKVIKEEIMAIFSDFFTRGKFEKSLNATFISLIPKVPGAFELNEFRPISVISGIYKIIAKVLAKDEEGCG
jgi:hypothetical protein